jgi:hypothetical protein
MHLKSSRAETVLAVFQDIYYPIITARSTYINTCLNIFHKLPCMNLNLFQLLKLISCQTLTIQKMYLETNTMGTLSLKANILSINHFTLAQDNSSSNRKESSSHIQHVTKNC